MESTLLRERLDTGIEVLRLNRPAKRNALDSATLTSLLGALEELATDAGLRVLVLSTTDPTAFCAGADLGEPLDVDGAVARMELFCRVYAAIDAFPAATVAVCVGNCVGGGAEIAVGCDLRVGGDNLKLAWAGARLGVPVGPARLAPLIGLSRTKDLLLTGRAVGIDEAERLGLIHRRAPAAQAEEAALELAATVAGQSPDGVRTIKAMLREFEHTEQRVAAENVRLMRFQREGSGLPRS